MFSEQSGDLCFYHSNTCKREKHTADNQPYDRINPKNTALPLPALDECDAIQLAISEVVLALAANTIDPRRRARILLYGLQIASQHYRHKTSHCHPDRSALARSGGTCSSTQDIIRETHQHEDGTIIGPEKQSPDPEDLPEKEQQLTLGRYLLLEAIKEGIIDQKEVSRKEEEWKEHCEQERNQAIHLQAVAENHLGDPFKPAVGLSGNKNIVRETHQRNPSPMPLEVPP